MPVIAMTQEMGSLAKDVAMDLTAALNLSMVRHEVVDHVAGKMHVSTSLIKRLREGKAGLIERATTDRARVALFSSEEVFELALVVAAQALAEHPVAEAPVVALADRVVEREALDRCARQAVEKIKTEIADVARDARRLERARDMGLPACQRRALQRTARP